jgi:hypothetical protein
VAGLVVRLVKAKYKPLGVGVRPHPNEPHEWSPFARTRECVICGVIVSRVTGEVLREGASDGT